MQVANWQTVIKMTFFFFFQLCIMGMPRVFLGNLSHSSVKKRGTIFLRFWIIAEVSLGGDLKLSLCVQVFSSQFGKTGGQTLFLCICTPPSTAKSWPVSEAARDFCSTTNKYIMHLLESSQTFHVIYVLI